MPNPMKKSSTTTLLMLSALLVGGLVPSLASADDDWRGRRGDRASRHRSDNHRGDRYDHGRRDRSDRHRGDRYRSNRHRDYGHYQRPRYDRHRNDRRHYRNRGFSIPRTLRNLHRQLRSEIRSFLWGNLWHSGHRHNHAVYVYPVRYGDRYEYRPYAYCEGELYGSGYLRDGRPYFEP